MISFIFSLSCPLKLSMMHFLNEPEVGNWSQTHSTKDSMSLATSFAMETNSLGSMIFFDVVIIIDACRYSNLALSSSLVMPSPVYILTCRSLKYNWIKWNANSNSCVLIWNVLYWFSRIFFFKIFWTWYNSIAQTSSCKR